MALHGIIWFSIPCAYIFTRALVAVNGALYARPGTVILTSPPPDALRPLKAVFYGHLKQEDLGSLPVTSEKSMFYGQLKQED